MTSQHSGTAHGTGPTPPWGATWCPELELSGDPGLRSVIPFAGQPHARVLVRLHGDPVGYLPILTGGTEPTPADVARLAAERFHAEVSAHLAAEGTEWSGGGVPAPRPGCPALADDDTLVSVVVCTRDRGSVLGACLERLRALTHPRLEVVVVDNAPSDGSTHELVTALAAEDPRFRYVVEPRPGLSCARNKGLAEARGDVIAYTDDDVAVDPGWVQGLLRGFARGADVGCVTGLVATAGIDTPEEAYFDARAVSWSSRLRPEQFDRAGTGRDGDVLYPYSAGVFGTGASLAFDAAFLRDLGGFDEALGAGSPTKGGEDLDAFLRVLRAGRVIAYEPSAVVWHHHRADPDGLRRQVFGYGTGLGAFLTKCLLQPGTRGELLRRIPVGIARMGAIRAQTDERLPAGAAAPGGALLRELAGLVAGPVLYLRARRAVASAQPRRARSRASA
ncbi:glycosyltransferase family 2 protein [Modestobacter sp. SYSU DS0657]